MHPVHPSLRFGLTALPLLLCSCAGPENKASFKLTVRPVLPPSQADLFDSIDTLLVRTAVGAEVVEEHEIDVVRGTSPAIEGLSALPEGVTVELEGYDGDDLVARGISEPLDVGRREKVSVDIYFSALGETATFNSLEVPSLGAAVASDGVGNFYVFGGTDLDWFGEPMDAIQRWSLLPPDDGLAPVTVASFPVYNGEWVSGLGARTRCTATLLAEGDHDDLGKILVTGGWEGFDSSDSVVPQAFLFDPAAAPDGAIEVIDDMNRERAAHIAVALGSGDVVLFGGFSWTTGAGAVNPATRVEVYRAADRSFVLGSTVLERGRIAGAAARLGDDALYCGGVEFAGNFYAAYGDCVQANRDAQASVLAGPTQLGSAGLLLPSMARLGSSAVLLSGGAVVDGQVNIAQSSAASRDAYIYDLESNPPAWRKATSMFVARAGHVSTALPDGRVLVAGGAGSVHSYGLIGDDLLACAEIYDPGSDSWAELKPGCGASTTIGSLPEGLFQPSTALDPYYGALIWGGLARNARGDLEAQPTYALFTPFPD